LKATLDPTSGSVIARWEGGLMSYGRDKRTLGGQCAYRSAVSRQLIGPV
jgi:hypothetical protein